MSVASSLRSAATGPALPIGLAALVHYTVVSDYFKHDDFAHLYQIANHGFWEFLLMPHGGHLLAASNLVFFLCFQVFGLAAEFYHGLALLTHLVNVWFLFLVVERTTGRRVLAVFGAAMWGMSPLARGSIGWFSVYGHVLAATAVLWVLADVAKVRRDGVAVPGGMMLRWLALLLTAAMSFGVGLGVAMMFGGVVYALLPATPNRNRTALGFGGLALCLPVIYGLQHYMFIALWGPMLADGRAAITRIGENFIDSVVMFMQLLAFAISSLLSLVVRQDHGRDLLPRFEGLESEVMFLTSVIGIAYAVGIAWAFARSPRERRFEICGFLLIALASYGVIALGRAGLMASSAPSSLWAVSSPRYHYLGTIGLVVALCLALASIPRRERSQGPWLLLAWLALALPLDFLAARSIESKAGIVSRLQHQRVEARVRKAVASRPEGANVFIRNASFKPVRLLPLTKFPGEAAVFVFTFPENEVDGRHVYFTTKRGKVLAAAAVRKGSRIDELLISVAEKERLKGGQ